MFACIAWALLLIAASGPPPYQRNSMTTNQNVWEKSGSSMTWTGNVAVAGLTHLFQLNAGTNQSPLISEGRGFVITKNDPGGDLAVLFLDSGKASTFYNAVGHGDTNIGGVDSSWFYSGAWFPPIVGIDFRRATCLTDGTVAGTSIDQQMLSVGYGSTPVQNSIQLLTNGLYLSTYSVQDKQRYNPIVMGYYFFSSPSLTSVAGTLVGGQGFAFGGATPVTSVAPYWNHKFGNSLTILGNSTINSRDGYIMGNGWYNGSTFLYSGDGPATMITLGGQPEVMEFKTADSGAANTEINWATRCAISTNVADFTGITTSGTSVSSAAILGKSMGLSENLNSGGYIKGVGLGSTSTTTASPTATGWTNSTAVNMCITITNAVDLCVYDNAGGIEYTNLTITHPFQFRLQPSGYFTGTSISNAPGGGAHAW